MTLLETFLEIVRGWRAVYPLTTDLKGHACTLLQIYSGRWQIEVNHREEKDTIGVGQAQLWNEVSVPKQPREKCRNSSPRAQALGCPVAPLRGLSPCSWYA